MFHLFSTHRNTNPWCNFAEHKHTHESVKIAPTGKSVGYITYIAVEYHTRCV